MSGKERRRPRWVTWLIAGILAWGVFVVAATYVAYEHRDPVPVDDRRASKVPGPSDQDLGNL